MPKPKNRHRRVELPEPTLTVADAFRHALESRLANREAYDLIRRIGDEWSRYWQSLKR